MRPRLPRAGLSGVSPDQSLARARLLAGALLSVLMLAVPSSHAADAVWTRVRASHFEMASDATPEAAQEAAGQLEVFHDVLARLLGRDIVDREMPTLILVLESGDVFNSLCPRFQGRPAEVDGFLQAGSGRQYLVTRIRASGRPPGEVLRHEYVHLILSQVMAVQPLWLAEGLAELFSDLELIRGEARLGRPRPEHLSLLRMREMLPLETLLTVRDDSELYYEHRDRPVFYAQSWALTHALVVGQPDGREKLANYLVRVARGMPEDQAYRTAFGEDLNSARDRLRAYVARDDLASLSVLVEPATPDVVVRPMAPGQVEQAMGDILLHAGRLDEAERHLQAALKADPAMASAHEALANLSIRRGRYPEARQHVAAALAIEPHNPAALYRYAEALERDAAKRGEAMSEETEEEVVQALEECIGLAPYFADACQLLARLRPQPRGTRIAMLEAAWEHCPTRADLGLTLAGLHLTVGDTARAVEALERSRHSTRDEAIRFLCDYMLAYLRGAAQREAEVEAELTAMDCPDLGGLVFRLCTADTQLTLQAASPTDVLLLGPEGEPYQRTLNCGPQSAWVRARFIRTHSPSGYDGTLLALTFME